MARRSAFAFRDFDAEKILQRNFFKNLDLPKGVTDLEILFEISFNEFTPIEEASKKLMQNELIASSLELYEKRIWKHLHKLLRLDGKDPCENSIYYSIGNGKLSELINSYILVHHVINFFHMELKNAVIRLRKAMKAEIVKNFGKNLKNLRASKGFTQVGFAEKLGISQSGVAAYENGSREPGLTMLCTIARILGVSMNELTE